MTIRNIKIILLGEQGSGKSSLISSYLFGHPVVPRKPILFGSYCRNATVQGEDFRLNICDSSGEQDFLRLQTMSYLDADLLVICVDSTQKKGLRRAEEYAEKTKESQVPVILCMTKIDLAAGVEDKEIKKFVEKYQMNGVLKCTSNNHKMVVETFENMIEYAKAGTFLMNRSCCGVFNCYSVGN